MVPNGWLPLSLGIEIEQGSCLGSRCLNFLAAAQQGAWAKKKCKAWMKANINDDNHH